jgi:tRNA A37 threonylcarbamoyladenosine modification protein TsaB
MILIINTTDHDNLKIHLVKDGNSFWTKQVSAKFKQAEKLLKTIEVMLEKRGLDKNDLTGIGVVSGPGGFTAIRIGVVTSNTFSYALKIPIVELKQIEFDGDQELVNKIITKLKKKKGKFNISKNIVLPFYDREPNIG